MRCGSCTRERMAKNPVMFVVEVGSVLTTDPAPPSTPPCSPARSSCGSGSRWCSRTWPKQWPRAAGRRRRRRCEPPARRRWLAGSCADGSEEHVPGTQLRPGDRVVVEPNEIIPGDGEVVEGVASVDESAITGESAPVIRESGGDRSAVTGGTKVLSDRIVVQITSMPGETFIDRMIALVEGAHATEDAERDRPEHPAGQPDDHLPAGDRHVAAVRDLLGARGRRSWSWSRSWCA